MSSKIQQLLNTYDLEPSDLKKLSKMLKKPNKAKEIDEKLYQKMIQSNDRLEKIEGFLKKTNSKKLLTFFTKALNDEFVGEMEFTLQQKTKIRLCIPDSLLTLYIGISSPFVKNMFRQYLEFFQKSFWKYVIETNVNGCHNYYCKELNYIAKYIETEDKTDLINGIYHCEDYILNHNEKHNLFLFLIDGFYKDYTKDTLFDILIYHPKIYNEYKWDEVVNDELLLHKYNYIYEDHENRKYFMEYCLNILSSDDCKFNRIDEMYDVVASYVNSDPLDYDSFYLEAFKEHDKNDQSVESSSSSSEYESTNSESEDDESSESEEIVNTLFSPKEKYWRDQLCNFVYDPLSIFTITWNAVEKETMNDIRQLHKIKIINKEIVATSYEDALLQETKDMYEFMFEKISTKEFVNRIISRHIERCKEYKEVMSDTLIVHFYVSILEVCCEIKNKYLEELVLE